MMKSIGNKVKIACFVILLVASVQSFNMSFAASFVQTKQTSYSKVTEMFDWGAANTKVTIKLGKQEKQGAVSTDTFKVLVSRSDVRLKGPFLGEGYRTIKKAYVSDKKGNPVSVGNYATLEMEIGSDISLGSPLNYNTDTLLNSWVDYKITITQVKDIGFGKNRISGLVASKCIGETKVLADNFSIRKSKEYYNNNFSYVKYKPAKDKKKNPLIIWLHGGGEGGTDANLILSVNKSAYLSSKKFQSYFGGTYVLMPQAKIFWGESHTTIGPDGKYFSFDGKSIYEDSLMAFIKDYVSSNKDIDPNRIYIGGCSNGGYMTMLMIRDYPQYFAAAFPICEGLINEFLYDGVVYPIISEADIQKLKDVPTWFVSSKNDPTVPPEEYSTKTYERLLKAGAKNVFYSLFDDVHDTSGVYKNSDGTPHQYHGHFSWIYVFNNECTTTINGKETTIMEWLASMSLNKRYNNKHSKKEI